MKILFYDARDYDRDSFDAQLKNYPNIKIDYIAADLSPVTASLARGYDAVCAFVNSDASAMALEILRGFDVKLVLMRSAGFDAVNVPVAKDLRQPARQDRRHRGHRQDWRRHGAHLQRLWHEGAGL